jgi:hypothetical protein
MGFLCILISRVYLSIYLYIAVRFLEGGVSIILFATYNPNFVLTQPLIT